MINMLPSYIKNFVKIACLFVFSALSNQLLAQDPALNNSADSQPGVSVDGDDVSVTDDNGTTDGNEPTEVEDVVDSGDKPSFPSDQNRYDGDRLQLRVNADIFRPIGKEVDPQCAPSGSKMSVNFDNGESLSLRFVNVPSEDDWIEAKAGAFDECPKDKRVNEVTQYTVQKEELEKFDFGRSGVTFGGLVVPFKFYLGGDNKITASSTIAPYIGFSYPDVFGITIVPFISAGLGLVPVTDTANNTSETKAAFSGAIGFVLKSNKNSNFNAGVIFGKDFVSDADKEADPILDEIWMSIYAGYSL